MKRADGEPDGRRSIEESALDEYLEASLRGEEVDLDAFCARFGEASAEVRVRLEAFRRMLGEEPATGEGPAPEPGLPFERLGDFRLVRRLGEGGMGVVFLAEQESLRRLVALKVLRPERSGSPVAEARFRREAEAVARLRHPNIVAVFATGEERGVRYLAMELVSGRGLDEVLAEAASRGERVPAPRIVRWVADVARALQAAHEAGLVHRDVKPANVRITPEGRALLLDFGLARGLDGDTLTATGEFRGTPQYAAPEQVDAGRGEIDARTDVYALGATLYEAATGAVPFEGTTTEQIFHGVLSKDPIPARRRNPAIPRDLEVVIATAMEKEPARRYPSAAALADDLEALLEVRPIRARPAGAVTRAVKWARRNRPSAAAAAVALLAALASAGVLLAQHWRSARAFDAEISEGENFAARGEFEAAIAALDRALGIRPNDAPTLLRREDLRRRDRGARAEAAVAEARRGLEAYRGLQADLEPLRARVLAQEREFESAYMKEEEVAAFFGDRDALERLRRDLRTRELAVLEALNRAGRLHSELPAISATTADLYMEKWRAATAERDKTGAALFREKVLEHDLEGRWRSEIEGDGTVEIAGTPAGAEIHLFRYELHSSVKPGGDRRLVPVPFSLRAGSPSSTRGAFPGDAVLLVDRVEKDSPADLAGIRAGDHVLDLAGGAVDESPFVLEASGPASGAGVRPLERLTALGSAAIRSVYDLELAHSQVRAGEDYEAEFSGGARVAAKKASRELGEDFGVRLLRGVNLLEGRLPAGEIPLRVVSDGEAREVVLPGARDSGLRVSPTSYPLFLSDDSLLGRSPIPPASLPPGSYLFLVRAGGFEHLRLPVRVEPGSRARLEARLHPHDTSPSGFFWIPPGPFLAGGDPDAPRSWDREVRETEGYWIAEREVTVEEYLEFLNDPATIAEIDAADEKGETLRIPRTTQRPLPGWTREGDRYRTTLSPRWPVFGVSWEDAVAYCAWRTARARDAGEPWTFDLPTEVEWEKAARGVDGRAFPWGDEFDWRFCKGGLSRPSDRHPEPVLRFAADASPWRVRDLAGGVQEWCEDETREGRARATRGGSWGRAAVWSFRSAYRSSATRSFVDTNLGFRLVARRESGN